MARRAGTARQRGVPAHSVGVIPESKAEIGAHAKPDTKIIVDFVGAEGAETRKEPDPFTITFSCSEVIFNYYRVKTTKSARSYFGTASNRSLKYVLARSGIPCASSARVQTFVAATFSPCCS